MKSAAYHLKLHNPCNQSWDSMTENGSGKFCSACAKTVVDFTGLADADILHLIQTSSGKLCGRLTQTQLNQTLEETQSHRSSLPFNTVLAGAFLISTTSSALSDQQQSLPPTNVLGSHTENSVQNQAIRNKPETVSDSTKNTIRGTVFDASDHLALPGIYVQLKGTEVKAMTNATGLFSLTIPASYTPDKITLIFAQIGYQRLELTLKAEDLPLTKEVYLNQEQSFLGEVVLIPVKKKKWWQKKH
ncbi:carboxypeptidase-like regulatory domain-containing protein [Spirosoma sp. SC4-14]|uniref:carboxypeptidase-like regulatory domain-containing protein n=1 Tax=Spirosoma sp. SC4-14 TaxID=3128900 RepID=UPI0030CD0FC2